MLRSSLALLASALVLAGCSSGTQVSRAGDSGSDALAAARPATAPLGPRNIHSRAITGASQAVCTPRRCGLPGPPSTYTLGSVPNGDGTTSPRSYTVYRPAGLVASPRNRAPAMLVFYAAGSCGLRTTGRFPLLASEHRFVVVVMEVPCGRAHSWEKRNVDSPTFATPNDEPYVTAVIRDITRCPGTGARPNQCIDPRRIYAAGQSSGGNMVADIMCDPQNSPRVRGYLIDSSSIQLFRGVPHCQAANRSFFVMLVLSNYGADRGLYYDTAPNPHLDVRSFAAWAARRLGCHARPTVDSMGSPVASTRRYTYSGPCTDIRRGSAAVVALGVGNGGHGWDCQDSDPDQRPLSCPGMPNPPGLSPSGKPKTNGLFVEEMFWDFVARGRG